MIGRTEGCKVYLACGATDMRKNIDGLAALVSAVYDLDPFSDSMFVFCGKSKDRLKILHWDRNGFWLYCRRLESGKFRWPTCVEEASTLLIDRRQLNWLLDGLALEQRQAHKPVTARAVI